MRSPSAPGILHAPWVLTGAGEALSDAAVVHDADGTILAVGPAAELLPAHAGANVRTVRAVLMPGLVNARVRLGHAALRGHVPGGAGFAPWAERVGQLAARLDAEALDASLGDAAEELRASGAVAVGVVGPRSAGPEAAGVGALARRGMRGWWFAEAGDVAGEGQGDAAGVAALPPGFRAGEAARGLYAHEREILAALGAQARAAAGLIAVPLLEHAAARAWLRAGSAPAGLCAGGAGEAFGEALRAESPVDAAESVGLAGASVLAVGLADARRAELDRLAAAGTRVVLCPRADLYVQTLLPPLTDVLAAGLRPALGSDSPAGNTTLDVLAEAATLAARFPGVRAGTLFAMASGWGADALGLPGVGRIERGARPGVLAVALPAGGAAVSDPHAHAIKSAVAARAWVLDGD